MENLNTTIRKHIRRMVTPKEKHPHPSLIRVIFFLIIEIITLPFCYKRRMDRIRKSEKELEERFKNEPMLSNEEIRFNEDLRGIRR